MCLHPSVALTKNPKALKIKVGNATLSLTPEEQAGEAPNVGQAHLYLDSMKSLFFLCVTHVGKSLYIPVAE